MSQRMDEFDHAYEAFMTISEGVKMLGGFMVRAGKQRAGKQRASAPASTSPENDAAWAKNRAAWKRQAQDRNTAADQAPQTAAKPTDKSACTQAGGVFTTLRRPGGECVSKKAYAEIVANNARNKQRAKRRG